MMDEDSWLCECEICGSEFSMLKYSDSKCAHCGQDYEYEEGYRLKLSDLQINTLRDLRRDDR